MSTHHLDVSELLARIDTKRGEDGLSYRSLARELGFSPSVFSRMRVGQPPSVNPLVTLMSWLDTDISYVTKPKDQIP